MIKARTVFAFLFYGTFCYLVISGKDVPEVLTNIVLMIMAFYYGNRSKKGGTNV